MTRHRPPPENVCKCARTEDIKKVGWARAFPASPSTDGVWYDANRKAGAYPMYNAHMKVWRESREAHESTVIGE